MKNVDEVVQPIDRVRSTPSDTLFFAGLVEIEMRFPIENLGQHTPGRPATGGSLEIIQEVEKSLVSVHQELLLDIDVSTTVIPFFAPWAFDRQIGGW